MIPDSPKRHLSETLRKQFSDGIGYLSQPLRRAADLFSLFGGRDEASSVPSEQTLRGFIAMIHQLIWIEGSCDVSTVQEIRRTLLTRYSGSEISALSACLESPEPPPNHLEDCTALRRLPLTERQMVLDILTEIAMARDGMTPQKKKALTQFTVQLDLAPDMVEACIERIQHQQNQTKNRVVSLSGLITAILILILFGLTATLLRSVFFGVIVAFLLLPVQQLCYHWIFNTLPYRALLNFKNRWVDRLFCLFGIHPSPRETSEDPELRLRRSAASHSAFFSFIAALLVGSGVVIFAIIYSVSYVHDTGRNLRNWADQVVTQEKIYHADSSLVAVSSGVVEPVTISSADTEALRSSFYFSELISGLARRIESFGDRFQTPEIRKTILQTADYIRERDNREKIGFYVAERLNSAAPQMLTFLGSSFRIGMDILLSVFFCALFLQIFAIAVVNAQYTRTDKSPGFYLTSLLFSTVWFPNLPETARAGAAEVLDNVIQKISVWIRGYFTIILVEAPIYITIFAVIGIPYPLILGLLASCSLLIPIIAPTAIVILTLLLTLTMPGVTLLDVIAVAGTFLVIMGLLEALVLYPRMVGFALGLNLLETVAVVLLGGYLFALPGLLLAVPTASVLKYLIPRIWQCWAATRNGRITESGIR